jgi:hemerythrin superfamily protein
MSVLDKVVAAVTPTESDEQRLEARQQARASATQGDFLSLIVDQHEQLEQLFERVRTATDAQSRIAAHEELAHLLNGHSLAEEVVVYPAMANFDEKARATKAYTEHTATKIQMGLLETIPVMSQEYLDKLEHIRGAVLHHMYEEEHEYTIKLLDKLPADERERLTTRFKEEFGRYAGGLEGTMQRMGAALGANGSSRMQGTSPGLAS